MFENQQYPLQPSNLQKDVPISIQTNVNEDLYEAQKKFEAAGVENTIVIFGSARITPEGSPMSIYYQQTIELAARLAKQYSFRQKDRHYICTGGGPGIMEAAAKGARSVGAESVGLFMDLPFERTPNPYISQEFSHKFKTFMLRKLYFIYYMRACIVMPGGFGTLDELFEVLTLIACHKLPKIPVILHDRAFWDKSIDLGFLASTGVINGVDLSYIHKSDSVDETIQLINNNLNL